MFFKNTIFIIAKEVTLNDIYPSHHFLFNCISNLCSFFWSDIFTEDLFCLSVSTCTVSGNVMQIKAGGLTKEENLDFVLNNLFSLEKTVNL